MAIDPKEVDAALAESTAITPATMKKFVDIGMSKVDKADVLPPQIVLVQKTSDFDIMQSSDGKVAKKGQFFHTGKREIYDEVDCYILFAAKSEYKNKYNKEVLNEMMPQYTAIGILKKDKTLFGMKFRASAIYTLSPLFTAVTSMQVPMFAFNVKFESKELSGDKGSWHIPVCRVGEVEKDGKMLNELYALAAKWDAKADDVVIKVKHEEEKEDHSFPPEE